MAARRTLALLALIAGVSSSQTSDCSYISLLKHLNLESSNHVLEIMRPVKNWTQSTLVQIDMLMYGIVEVDEKSQSVTSLVWINMQWKNEWLTWNSSDFCGIDRLTLPRTTVWIPDINMQEDTSDTSSGENSPLVVVHSDGLTYATLRKRLIFTCQLNLKLFPFDKQYCAITFASMTSDVGTIKLGTVNTDTNLTKRSERSMITQGEWALKHMETQKNAENASLSKLVYAITLERKPMLYVVILIVPLFYLLILDLASFFISEARGEKLSFKVTILLSISVLLLILRDMLPSTEDNLPMIASYFIGVFALVGLSVLEAMLMSFLVDLDNTLSKKAQTCENAHEEIELEVDYHKEPAQAEKTDQVKTARSFPPLDWPSEHDLLGLILDEVKAARQKAAGKKHGCCRKMAVVIDAIFFVCYFLTIVVCMTYMYLYWIAMWK